MRRHSSFAYCLLAVLASLFLLAARSAQAQNGQRLLITQNVDESKLVTLAGNTRPEAKAKNDRGMVPATLTMDHMLLQLKRSPEQEQALVRLIDELHDSSSPNFHHWLTAKEFGTRFGVAKQDREAIKNLATVIRPQGQCGLPQRHAHRLLRNCRSGTGEPSTPKSTNLNVKGAEAFRQHERSEDSRGAGARGGRRRVVARLQAAPDVQAANQLYFYRLRSHILRCGSRRSRDHLQLESSFTAGISGQGQTVVVVEDTNVFTTADWTTFRSCLVFHHLPERLSRRSTLLLLVAPIIAATRVRMATTRKRSWMPNMPVPPHPSATIVLASCSDTTTFGGLIALQNLLNESSTPPAIVSMSYGECEALNGATLECIL